ncbi:MAG: GHKL domain-containing protein [Clostridia bacterium]|nr:GHKL domain-containing protein [Clostridia bacterium]
MAKLITFGSVKKTVVFSIIVIVSVLLINAAVYFLISIINKQNKEKAEYVIMENQYRGQKALLDEATRQQENLAKLRHDLSNTLGVINGLIASGKFDEATAFIKANTEILSVDTRAVKTNNEYVNAIINYKSAVAKENGIDVSVYSVSNIAFPDNVDFCSLIGNMFDNAIQGAAECKGSRMIRLDISRDGDGYRILMCNSVPAPVLKSNPNLETTKKGRESHGFGTKIIRQIADKYNGTTDFYDAEGGRFCCSVVVYPEKQV